MTAGTVVITGGILATVILLCIIAVLCYCRLQVLPKDGEGDPVGLEPEGWLCMGSPQEDREGRGPGYSGGGYSQTSGEMASYGARGVSVQFSDQLPSSLKAFAEAQRDSRALQWHTATLQESSSQERAALPSLACLSFRAF